ncbi:hypothetical protein BH09BAC1_BH09BAC1_05080 [soil metagenome]
MFNLDFVLLSKWMLPARRRKAKLIAWLTAGMKAVAELYFAFLLFRAATLYKLSFTGQIIYLEKLLNDQFNNGYPAYTNGLPTGIYISDPSTFIFPTYLWHKIEQRPKLYLYHKSEGKPPAYLYHRAELNSQYDFIVNVPFQLGNVVTDLVLLARIKAWINIYRIAGNRYKIVNYIP